MGQRPIDANLFEAYGTVIPEEYKGAGEAAFLAGVAEVLERIDDIPTIATETLPVVQKLQERVKDLEKQLSDWKFWWGPVREQEAQMLRENQAAVKVMRKHCEKTIADLREELAKVTAERDAAEKDRAELADYELAVCEQFCFGDREHNVAPCAWLIDGMCKLRKWRGPRKEDDP